jgi:2-dehydro-3-deoxygluconokinase
MTRYDFLTFGETMIRLSTRHYERLEQAHQLDMRYGGAEANTAVGLAKLGYKPAWVSRLPRNPLGLKIANDLMLNGVDTSHIVWTDEGRVGLFFVEFSAAPRPSAIVYDRRNSTMSQMTSADFPWDLLRETRWLHLTGITAALSDGCRQLVVDAMRRAHELNLTVSFDVNYRARLWTPAQARATLEPLCQEADVFFVTQSDAAKVFDAASRGETPEATIEHLAHHFARKVIVMTLSADGAIALERTSTGQQLYRAAPIPVPFAVDRIGAGDAFAAGFIAGYLEAGCDKGLQLGSAMASLKMTIPGDLALVTRNEVEELLAGHTGNITR